MFCMFKYVPRLLNNCAIQYRGLGKVWYAAMDVGLYYLQPAQWLKYIDT